ncbi:MAG: chromosomal replication initiator protein DnaA [Lentisphaeria bacterium]|nr:chromosomal replication initiator protein DnaA [Lentisphaeria bacterium]
MGECARFWYDVKNQLAQKVDEDSWDSYLSGIVPVSINEETCELVLGVLNDFVALWLDSNYKSLIEDEISTVKSKAYAITFVGGYKPEIEATEKPVVRTHNTYVPQTTKIRVEQNLRIRPDFTFDNFVIGNNNKLCVAAAKSVTQHLGTSYNPFFVYGGVGLGKTHLLQAIANDVLKHHPHAIIEYHTSEEFVNLYVEAVQNNSLVAFRKRFRNADLLLIDDVQFFSGKVGSSEEFFHTFNTLHNAHRQIVLASDRTPHDIGLEDRLVSRFDWGLSAEILAPELETRVAILKKKQETQTVKLSDEVLFLVASRIESNMRTLESALTILTMNVSALGSEMTVELAEELLKNKFENEAARMLTVDHIQKHVADHFDIKLADIISKKRPQNIAHARMVGMYLSRQLTDLSYPVIGEAFNRNHATIVHAVDTIRKKMAKDETFRSKIAMLTKYLKG